MAVNQGIKTFAEASPQFSNSVTQSLITAVVSEDSTTNFASRTYYLIRKAEASADITNAQRTDLNNSLDTQSHLNIGRYLYDLEQHTTNILNGSLGEPDPTDGNTGTFFEHLSLVQSFIATIPSLFGYSADSISKGFVGHFGTLSGTVDTALASLKSTVDRITSLSLATDTAYQSAVQAVSDHIDTMDGSSTADISTYNALLSALEIAASNFNTALSAGNLVTDRTTLINVRTTIRDQFQLESNNLGAIRTYETSLSDVSQWLVFASDDEARALLIRASGNPDWRSYFENYATNLDHDNPIYNNTESDSTNAAIIDSVLRLKGLPDVDDYVDLDSVAAKALRDTRLKTRLKDSGKTTEDIIRDACVLLSINIDNRDVYAQSKSLLENMTQHDRDTVQNELNLYNDVNTLS